MRMVGPALLFVLPGLTFAQQRQRGADPPFKSSGAFFALSVSDLEASTKWYAEKFGLSVVMRAPKANGAAATVLEGGGLTVELIQRDDARSLRDVAPGVGANYQVHGIFKVGLTVDDYDATLAQLRARGVPIALGPFPARAGQPPNVIVRDNAGNLIQFFGRKPP